MARLDGARTNPPLLGRRRLTRGGGSDSEGSEASEDDAGVRENHLEEEIGIEEGDDDGEEGRGSGSDGGIVASDAEEGDSDYEKVPAPARGSKTAAVSRSRRVLQEDSDTE